MSKNKSRINKERIYDSMFDTINYNEKLVKDELDLTAKLEVSNVFTQPQQVPNATLPQHTTNLSQVETMFEMFKQQLRGYNLAMPDLTGKEYLGDGVYRLYDNYGITIDYNVFNGEFTINGSFTGSISFIVATNVLEVGSTYTASIYKISGSAYLTNRPLITLGDSTTEANYIEYSMNSKVLIATGTQIRFYLGADGSYDNLTFKLQIEKGDTATPYTVPGQIPQYKIVGEE